MGWEAMEWALHQPIRGSTDHLVLVALGSYVGNGKTDAFPSQETLAAKINRSRRTIQRALKRLEGNGWIHRTPQRRPDGRRSTDLIRLVGFVPDAGVLADPHQGDISGHSKGTARDSQGVKQAPHQAPHLSQPEGEPKSTNKG